MGNPLGRQVDETVNLLFPTIPKVTGHENSGML